MLYLIPARGGSKGIPGKNIKPLHGIPLIAHTIRCALAAGARPDQLIVSTDSEEIATVAREYGATVPFIRPAELATDTSGSREVMLHAIDEMARLGHPHDSICLLQPTSPFRRPEDIINSIALYEQNPEADMVVSVVKSAANPYYNLFETTPEGYLHISKGDGKITRRQDAPTVWEFNGAVYVIKVESLRKSVISQFAKTIPYEMPADRSIDLDSPADWLRAEAMVQV